MEVNGLTLSDRSRHLCFLTDVAFLVSNYFKEARRGTTGENNIYTALGGMK